MHFKIWPWRGYEHCHFENDLVTRPSTHERAKEGWDGLKARFTISNCSDYPKNHHFRKNPFFVWLYIVQK